VTVRHHRGQSIGEQLGGLGLGRHISTDSLSALVSLYPGERSLQRLPKPLGPADRLELEYLVVCCADSDHSAAPRLLWQGRPAHSFGIVGAHVNIRFQALVVGLPWQRLQQLQVITRV